MFENIMTDIETVGKRAGCGILSIGAVPFNSDGVATGQSFYVEIDRQSCRMLGMHEDEDTLKWWSQQSAEARAVFEEGPTGREKLPIQLALQRFSEYMLSFVPVGRKNDVKLWGNGSDFDNTIIARAYEMTSMEAPWKFYNNRCYRTLKNMFPTVKLVRQGVYHNALSDAVTQAHHAKDIFKLMEQLKCASTQLTGENAGQ